MNSLAHGMIRKLRKGVANPRKAVAIVACKLLRPFSSSKYKKFVVLSRSRTGSNLLISLLNSHPQVVAGGEYFRRLHGLDHNEVLRKAFSGEPFPIKAKGFKIFYYHPVDEPSSGVWDKLRAMADLSVIHLKRKNLLRTLVSRKIAGVEDVWLSMSEHNPRSSAGHVNISFTVDELTDLFRETRVWEESGHRMFCNHPMLTIYYEDLVTDRAKVFRQVTQFLGVSYIEPKTELKKQNNRSLRATIMNYDDLKLRFSSTEWALFFEE